MKRLVLKKQAVRYLGPLVLLEIKGGVTGSPCDIETKQASKCDAMGCSGGTTC